MHVELVDMFRELAKKQRKVISGYLKGKGIFIGQHRTLFKLQKNPEITLTDLANELEVSKESLSVSLKRLENSELVLREQSMEDKRKILFSLTEKGEAVANHVRLGIDQINENMFKDFSDKEKNDLSFLFEKMIKGLEEEIVDEKIV